MADYVSVGKVEEVLEGELAAFEVEGMPIAVANVDGSFYALSDVCTHQQCSLSEGYLDGTTVTCPCHGSEFDVTTGDVITPPATEPVETYPVQLEDDEIRIEI